MSKDKNKLENQQEYRDGGFIIHVKGFGFKFFVIAMESYQIPQVASLT